MLFRYSDHSWSYLDIILYLLLSNLLAWKWNRSTFLEANSKIGYFFFVGDDAEMVEAMKKVAQLDVELTVEERNLVSVGYKNVIGARRASWRILSSIEQKEESKGNDENVKRLKNYRKRVEDELAKVCNDILSVIDKHLIPSSNAVESTVFFYKMWVSSLLYSDHSCDICVTKNEIISVWLKLNV